MGGALWRQDCLVTTSGERGRRRRESGSRGRKGGEEDLSKGFFLRSRSLAPTWPHLGALELSARWASSAGGTPTATRSGFHHRLSSNRLCLEFLRELALQRSVQSRLGGGDGTRELVRLYAPRAGAHEWQSNLRAPSGAWVCNGGRPSSQWL